MINKTLRKKVYKKLNGCCGYCGINIEMKDMQVDHIIPRANWVFHIKNQYNIPDFLKHLTIEDRDHIDNLMPSCRVCNKWKNTFHLDTFRKEIAEQINRLNKHSSNYRLAKKYGLVSENKKEILFYFEKIKYFNKGNG